MLMMVSVVLSQLNMNGSVFIVNFLFMFEYLANLLLFHWTASQCRGRKWKSS